MKVISIHRHDTANVGDLYGSPATYFPLSEEPRRDVFDQRGVADADWVIVGGGGLMSEYFNAQLNRALAPAKRLIVWAVGNHHYDSDFQMAAWTERAALIGIRDFGRGVRWVPCPSCMSSLFDAPPQPTRRAVFFRHHDRNFHVSGVPTRDNYHLTLGQAIAFLASAEFVVTDSYHGMYWGTLLGRRVIVYSWNRKFDDFKYPPTFFTGDPPWEALMDQAIRYPDALAECRTANCNFYRDVKLLIR